EPATYAAKITIQPSGGTTGNPATIGATLVVTPGDKGLTVTPRQAQYGTTPAITVAGKGFATNESGSVSGGPFDNFSIQAGAPGACTPTRHFPSTSLFGGFTPPPPGATSSIQYSAPFYLTSLQLQTLGIKAGRGPPLLLNGRSWQRGGAVRLTVQPA